ncbi:MAG TPA: FUSC family membrane protein, partial [Burkholderiaceae bacterium]|nr:FUSC family membrane protein [Burkholderiaceae bacterium]
ALLFGWVFNNFSMGMVAAFGAACVAIIDQPRDSRRHSTNTMLGAVALGTLTVAITGYATTHDILFWFVIPALAFFFSLLTVYGKQGGLMAFACLLLMTLTMRTTLQTQELLHYTSYSFVGGLIYFSYSFWVHRIFWLREQQQALSVALLATADYIHARSRFYDLDNDLDACYRELVRIQADMTEKHQAARNTLLHDLPRAGKRYQERRNAMIRIYIDMASLLDILVATPTDYETLRRALPEADFLVFARDALIKISRHLQSVGLSVARNQTTKARLSAKAELRAMEYDLMQFREQGFAKEQAETYALLVQILRRLRNSQRVAERMSADIHTTVDADQARAGLEALATERRLTRRNDLQLSLLTSNLHLNSPYFRYAIRLTIATMLALIVSEALSYGINFEKHGTTLNIHGYWIILTVIVIMKPGFALTRQRNGLRLAGTVLGSAIALAIFHLSKSHDVYFLILIASSIMGYSLVQVNYMAAATFNTIMVLMVFHFLAPSSPLIVGERLVDTLIGCVIALLCSYILPWWESNYMGALADKLKQANLEYFKTGLNYAKISRQQKKLAVVQNPQETEANTATDEQNATQNTLQAADNEWRQAQKSALTAFANYTAAFYRMVAEPTKRQHHVPELNHLMIQNHVLILQISASVPLLADLDEVPEGIQGSLNAIEDLLEGREATPPASIETEGDLATLAYPMRQMVLAAQLIAQEMLALQAPSQSSPAANTVAQTQ